MIYPWTKYGPVDSPLPLTEPLLVWLNSGHLSWFCRGLERSWFNNLASAIPTNSEMMAIIFLNKLLFPDVEEEGVVNQTKQSIATMFTVFLWTGTTATIFSLLVFMRQLFEGSVRFIQKLEDITYGWIRYIPVIQWWLLDAVSTIQYPVFCTSLPYIYVSITSIIGAFSGIMRNIFPCN